MTKYGFTALEAAALNGHTELVLMLVKVGDVRDSFRLVSSRLILF